MSEERLTIEEKMTIKELEEKIKGMKEDKERKCKAAKEQLVSMLEVTADKYRTATGTAEALRVIRFVTNGDFVAYSDEEQQCDDIEYASMLARDMAQIAIEMKNKAEELNYSEMDKLCEDFYLEEFDPNWDGNSPWWNLATEMMCIDLCRNVGGAAEDMVEFIKRVEEDIDATGRQLKELRAKEK